MVGLMIFSLGLVCVLVYASVRINKVKSERDDYEDLYNVSQSEYIRIREVNSLMHSEALQLTLELRDIRTISFNRGALLDEKNLDLEYIYGIIDMLAEAEVARNFPEEVNE